MFRKSSGSRRICKSSGGKGVVVKVFFSVHSSVGSHFHQCTIGCSSTVVINRCLSAVSWSFCRIEVVVERFVI